AHSQIEGKARIHFPVILNVRLTDPIALIEFSLPAVLSAALDCVHVARGKKGQEIREGVSCVADSSVDVAEGHETLNVPGVRTNRGIDFIFIGEHQLSAEL